MEKAKIKLHNRACRLLGINPNKVRLVNPSEFKTITGSGVSTNAGIIDYEKKVYYVRRGEGLSVYLHELLHYLFRHKPHWWIFASAWKIRGLRGAENSVLGARYGYGRGYYVGIHKIIDVPSKTRLIKLSKQAAQRKGVGATQ